MKTTFFFKVLLLGSTIGLWIGCGQQRSVKAEDLVPFQTKFFTLNFPSDWTVDSDSVNWVEVQSPDIFVGDSLVQDSSPRHQIIIDLHRNQQFSGLQEFLNFHVSDELGAARVSLPEVFEAERSTGKLEPTDEESGQPEIYWHQIQAQYYQTEVQATEKIYFCYRDSFGIVARCESPITNDFERDGYLFDLVMQSFRWSD